MVPAGEAKNRTAGLPWKGLKIAGIVIAVVIGLMFGLREATGPSGDSTDSSSIARGDSLSGRAEGWDAPEREAEALAAEVRAHPDDGMRKLELAALLMQLGREPEAGRLVLDAYRVDPDNPEIVFNASMYFIAKEDWDEAERALEHMIRLRPESESARRTLDRIREAREAESQGVGGD